MLCVIKKLQNSKSFRCVMSSGFRVVSHSFVMLCVKQSSASPHACVTKSSKNDVHDSRNNGTVQSAQQQGGDEMQKKTYWEKRILSNTRYRISRNLLKRKEVGKTSDGTALQTHEVCESHIESCVDEQCATHSRDIAQHRNTTLMEEAPVTGGTIQQRSSLDRIHTAITAPIMHVGIIASKKVGNAVQRNRCKRLLRVSIREVAKQADLRDDIAVVIIARPPLCKRKSPQVIKELMLKLSSMVNNT